MGASYFAPNKYSDMNQSKLTGLKNIMWALGILLCTGAVVIGLLICVFRGYRGSKDSFTAEIGTQSADDVSSQSTDLSSAAGIGIARGELKVLDDTKDAGQEYIDSLTFLVDSTFVGLRNYSIVGSSQVWATESGSMPMASLDSVSIKFPNDGSLIPAASAAMVSKPKILIIGIGMDGLAKVDDNTFITNYDKLVNDILAASPDTKVVCCGLTSVTPSYTGNDGLGVSRVSDGNDWIQLVCRDTGAYYLNIGEEMCESVQLLTRFSASNGKTLNKEGLNVFLEYVRKHAVP